MIRSFGTSLGGGEVVTWLLIVEFFRRKTKIAFFALMIYLALC